jgi:hypothetical protein
MKITPASSSFAFWLAQVKRENLTESDTLGPADYVALLVSAPLQECDPALSCYCSPMHVPIREGLQEHIFVRANISLLLCFLSILVLDIVT